MSDYEAQKMPDVIADRLEVIDERFAKSEADHSLSDMLRYIWDNPEKWEDGIHNHLREDFDVDGLSDSANFVILGILFGTEYEHAYPRDGRDTE